MAVPDVLMAGREPPRMGPMAHGFATLGDPAERAVSQLAVMLDDAVQAPSRLSQAAALLTGGGRVGFAAGGSFLLFWDHGLVFSGTEKFQTVASLIISTSVVAWPLRAPSGAYSDRRGDRSPTARATWSGLAYGPLVSNSIT
jgi:hypothetical protein